MGHYASEMSCGTCGKLVCECIPNKATVRLSNALPIPSPEEILERIKKLPTKTLTPKKQVESVFKDFRRGRLTIGQMEKRIKDIVKGLVDAQAW